MYDALRDNRLHKNSYFNFEKVFIHGSYARNLQRMDSDLDIIVVSDDFSGIDIMTRKRLLQKGFGHSSDCRIDAICLTSEEFGYMRKEINREVRNKKLIEVVL